MVSFEERLKLQLLRHKEQRQLDLQVKRSDIFKAWRKELRALNIKRAGAYS